MSGFARQCLAAVGVLVALTILLGVAYPAAVWSVSRIGASSAEGSQLVDAHGCAVGSSLIGVDPHVPAGRPDPYLHGRVLGSAGDPMAPGDPAASAASNKGPGNQDLKGWIEARRAIIARREGVAPSAVPADAVTGSGSGLDPDISEAYAAVQVPRIARTNGMSEQQVRAIVDQNTSARQWGFLGESRVNVVKVNLALGRTAPSCHR
nr:potassium-transporting ATPase subunit C [Gordonia sp. SID5947]